MAEIQKGESLFVQGIEQLNLRVWVTCCESVHGHTSKEQ